MSIKRRSSAHSTHLVVVASVCLAVGCQGRQSSAQRLEQEYRRTGKEPTMVYPLAGKLTIDNEPPVGASARSRIVVIAHHATSPHASVRVDPRAFVNPDGSFEMPPLPAGKYVMVFADLKFAPNGFWGADGLKNLYNDPDVNVKRPQFVIDHRAPGKTDYEFNLIVAGETPVETPGPKALVGSEGGRK